MYGEPSILGDFDLTFLDFGVIKFLHPAALQADQVVVVSAAGKFKHRLATFEMVALEQSGLFKLGKYPIHGGKTDVLALTDQVR